MVMKKLAIALVFVLGTAFAGGAYACDCNKKKQEQACNCAGGACPGACPGKSESSPPPPAKTDKTKSEKKS
jgi:hypothetical protein